MKILAEVMTPGNGKTYEIMLDDKLPVRAIKESIIEEIEAFENGGIAFGKDATLFSGTDKCLLPDNCNLRKAGFRSGQMLILV